MAAPAIEAAETKTEKAAAAPAKSRFGGRRIKIAIIVASVMGIQAVAAMLLLPKGSSVTSSSGEAAESGPHAAEHAGKADNLEEVEVDKFSCSIELDDGILWFVSFRLFAAIDANSASHFKDAVNEKYKARVRQAVVKVVRMSSINDLRDPQLDLLKRNLKTELNNVLPKRYVQEIIISEIRTMQQ
jgi:flagellar basal body-associated protein FliL